jgi:hypothetical protein
MGSLDFTKLFFEDKARVTSTPYLHMLPREKARVPHISLVFREIWEATALSPPLRNLPSEAIGRVRVP